MNPYEVLGVSENADEETIKKSYRSLVKKYHPDKYVNNPLADLAAQKMKEVNQAYDMITAKGSSSKGSYTQRQSGYGGASQGYGQRSYNAQQNGSQGYNTYRTRQPSFADVRAFISQRRIAEARAMLENLPRTAEWYYLSGIIYMQSGWYEQGLNFLRTAVNMDPNNQEYRDALNNVQNRNQTYTNTTSSDGIGCLADGCCDCCKCCGLCTLCSFLDCC